MGFPLTIGEHTFDEPPSLADAVRRDAVAHGGTVVAGELPSQWLMTAMKNGQLDIDTVIALAAALLQSVQPAVLADAARLCVSLRRPELGPLIRLVLGAADMGVLLTADPADATRSLEDLLLQSWAAIADLGDSDVRRELLIGLRGAGMTGMELTILARAGTAEEIRLWLPAIVEDGFPSRFASVVAPALTRNEEVRAALLETFGELPTTEKTLLYRELRSSPEVSTDPELMGMLYLPG